jgi:uncharacterized membrane protein YbaN (DUF454 family)
LTVYFRLNPQFHLAVFSDKIVGKETARVEMRKKMANLKFKIVMVILLGIIFYVATLQPWVAGGLAVLWIIGYLVFMNWKRKT